MVRRCGYPCPINYNPADHYVHVLAVTPGQETECRSTVNMICNEFEKDPEGGQIVSNVVDYEVQNAKNMPELNISGTRWCRCTNPHQIRELLI